MFKINMNQTLYYMIFYSVVIIATIVGAYLHVVSNDVATSVITFVIGNGTGLFVPVPESKSSING